MVPSLAVVFDVSPSHKEIPKVSGLSASSFRQEYKANGRPVVLADGLEDWPALRKWTPSFFRESFGDTCIPVDNEVMRVRDLVDTLDQDDVNSYVLQLKIAEYFPELLPNLELSPHFLRNN